jgi:hypothetical protein
MTTNDFLFILFWGGLAELLILCIVVPVLLWTRTQLAHQRAQTRSIELKTEAAAGIASLLDEIYVDTQNGTVVMPKELEDRVLAARSLARSVNTSQTRWEIR